MRIRYSFSSRMTGRARLVTTNKHRIAVPKIIVEVIRKSDIVLEILDARFIDQTRNSEVENVIKSCGKKLIYVLNKADLVDEENLKKEIREKKIFPFAIISCLKRAGSRDLRERIKIEVNKMKIFDMHKIAYVGIVGYPNTGKSSLINFLTGSSAAATSSVAGYTKGIKKIKLTKDILLLDSPGVIPPNEDVQVQTDLDMQMKHTKINVKTYDKVKEPDLVVQNLLNEYPQLFESYYNIQADGDAEILLETLGKRNNFLKKGNIVDIDRTARLIIKDWQQGRIRQNPNKSQTI